MDLCETFIKIKSYMQENPFQAFFIAKKSCEYLGFWHVKKIALDKLQICFLPVWVRARMDVYPGTKLPCSVEVLEKQIF